MTWPTNDPHGGAPIGDPRSRPPVGGPTDAPPWASGPWVAPPPPIPSYVPPPPGQAHGPQDQLPRYAAPPPPTSGARPADWGERVGATLVDWVILFLPAMVLSGVWDSLGALAFLGLGGYLAWLNGSKGQSPGKAIMGLKVVRTSDGSTLGGPVGLVRALSLALMFAFTGGVLWVLALLWPVWDARRQALHDKIVSATVEAGHPRAQLGKDLFRP